MKLAGYIYKGRMMSTGAAKSIFSCILKKNGLLCWADLGYELSSPSFWLCDLRQETQSL